MPTARVVCGFSDNSREKRLVIKHEWLTEAMMTWSSPTGIIIGAALGGPHYAFADWVYRAPAVMLGAGSG